MNLSMTSPVQYLPGVGPARAALLSKMDIQSVGDLITHLPFRYNDFSVVSNIGNIKPSEVVTIQGTISSFKNFFTKTGKKVQQVRVSDETGAVTVTWFNQPYLSRILSVGSVFRFSGTVAWFGSTLTIISPEYEQIDIHSQNGSIHTGRLVPVYHETEGVTSKWFRKILNTSLPIVLPIITDPLPQLTQKKYSLPGLSQALQMIHFPASWEEIESSHHRLAFDELFALQLTSWELKRRWDETEHAPPLAIHKNDKDTFLQSLPFELTDDQIHAIDDIESDIQKPIAMNRLLVGDVGSGKTVVAAFAMSIASHSGLSSLLMAPTQILAVQHFRTLEKLLTPMNIQVKLITGSTDKDSSTSQSEMLISDPKTKEGMVFVGTHALLTRIPKNIHVGLVVIDEQQRFGVVQRNLLREQGQQSMHPHILTMTATPIPRTIALAAFGHVSLSVISQMPKGRKTVKTWLVPEEKREGAYAWIRKEIQTHGSQAFILCPFIEESESMSTVKAATTEFKRLSKTVFPDLKLGLLHGSLQSKEKNAVLESFSKKEFDILVTTPVVEVGVDIPNATIMLIETADRFGLAQLHQLRGRVGRSDQQSYCLLFTDLEEESSLTRLKALETTHSGPALAEHDLSIRGPGELFGKKQHGMPVLKIASLKDLSLLSETRDAVSELARLDPTFTKFPHLREMLAKSILEIENTTQN